MIGAYIHCQIKCKLSINLLEELLNAISSVKKRKLSHGAPKVPSYNLQTDEID